MPVKKIQNLEMYQVQLREGEKCSYMYVVATSIEQAKEIAKVRMGVRWERGLYGIELFHLFSGYLYGEAREL